MKNNGILYQSLLICIFIFVVYCTPSINNNPLAIQLDNHISVIISCKSRNKINCDSLSVVAKISNDTVPYSNELVLNRAFLPTKVSFKSFAASRIDANSLIITTVSSSTQYFFILSIQSTSLNVTKTYPSVAASNVRNVDITYASNNTFYLVADLQNKRKIARLADNIFNVNEISYTSGRSYITGNGLGAFITQTGDCQRTPVLYLRYNTDGQVQRCSQSQSTLCSQTGRQDIQFFGDNNAIWGLVNQDNIHLLQLKYSTSYTKSEEEKNNNSENIENNNIDKKDTVLKNSISSKINITVPNWNTNSPLLNCNARSNLIGQDTIINLPEKITDVQLTLDSSVNELAVSFQKKSVTCQIEGYLYSVLPNFSLKRVDNIDLPTVSCPALGFDRIIFENDFVLLRYDTTKINLQSLLPNSIPK
eukprot:TRINITY_DN623_c0_g1_i1.p1 TRINITY_DN623_c0_g1~~TRINITY_DN623_c0_g1_i1.p1  ORF type:complete len:420 (-),score=107.02 TRINITY_DN623_c0_g1_i1:12-1271(-)